MMGSGGHLRVLDLDDGPDGLGRRGADGLGTRPAGRVSGLGSRVSGSELIMKDEL